MNFLVIWMPKAHDDLAELWLDPSLRPRLALIAHGLDEQLAKDPESIGVQAFDNVFIADVGDLGVEYEVIPDDCHVRVLRLWNAQTGRPEPTDN